MEIIEQRPNATLVLLSKAEIGIINNALNEVCNGVDIPEFETRLGCTLSVAKNLLERMGQAYELIHGS